MCTLPYRAIVASAAALSSDLTETSALTPSTSALVRFSPSTAFASAASSMSQSMTFTPACARAPAMPSPIPDAAPVTNAVFPARSFIGISRIKGSVGDVSQDLSPSSANDNRLRVRSGAGFDRALGLHFDNQHMHL